MEKNKDLQKCQHIDKNGEMCEKSPAHYSKRTDNYICKDHLIELMYKIMRGIPIAVAIIGILVLIFL